MAPEMVGKASFRALQEGFIGHSTHIPFCPVLPAVTAFALQDHVSGRAGPRAQRYLQGPTNLLLFYFKIIFKSYDVKIMNQAWAVFTFTPTRL